MKVIGIDLAGRAKNPSGFALLSDHGITTRSVYSDDEIFQLCVSECPALVSIDAPLSLPKQGNLRKADASLIKRGFRVFPPTFAAMRSLTERGMCLAKKLRKRDFRVIEIHPRTSGLLLFKTPLRKKWVTELRKKGWRLEGKMSEHEIDAIMASLTGMLYLEGKTEEVGSADEGVIIVPLALAKFSMFGQNNFRKSS